MGGSTTIAISIAGTWPMMTGTMSIEIILLLRTVPTVIVVFAIVVIATALV